VKIIAFGDSLTVGYITPYEATPYASFLAPRLGPQTTIQVAAISGELTLEMLNRFDRDVVDEKPDKVIILGGANDIGWGLPAEKILSHLTAMYRKALEAKITPVACAVPSLLGADDFIPPRIALNQKIQKEAEALQIPYADLFTATADRAGRLCEDLSYDGLHLTPKGYEKIAQTLYERLFK
jgi:lysophospholipase L1-like esterase